MELLRYEDVTIRLQSGRVVGIDKAPAARPISPPAKPELSQSSPESIAPPRKSVELNFPGSFVGAPEFHTIEGRQSAGTAFLARRVNDPQLFVLTVRHLLGPDGGFRELVRNERVPGFVRGIRIDALFGTDTWHPVTGYAVPGGDDPQNPLFDLAVFKSKSGSAIEAPLLATKSPSIGEPIWIVARVRGGVPEGTFIHATQVIANTGRAIVCRFENSDIITNGASGAPALNAHGEVVGIYIGHTKSDGSKNAFLIPSPLIIQTLERL